MDLKTLSDKASDAIASFGGSWIFVFSFLGIMFSWIICNLFFIRFDPFPFILLNLILSTVAALQAPIIMMSQNRMEAKDRERQEDIHILTQKMKADTSEMLLRMDKAYADLNRIFIQFSEYIESKKD